MNCSLKHYLKKQDEKLSLRCQTSLCYDISKGLEYLHSQQVIHRDLTDVNVLLTFTVTIPVAKIADFGMSRILPFDFMSDSLSGLGHKPIYLPPEAAEEPYHYSYTLDVYSFGVIATQIVQVQAPLQSKTHLFSLFETISSDHTLKNIIHSCLFKNRKNRPTAAVIVSTIEFTTR